MSATKLFTCIYKISLNIFCLLLFPKVADNTIKLGFYFDRKSTYRRPQLIEPTLFHGHVDLDYKIDKMDENKAYKALKIHDLTPNMAGNYCCKVSTFVDEGYIMQQLNIYGNLGPNFLQIPI